MFVLLNYVENIPILSDQRTSHSFSCEEAGPKSAHVMMTGVSGCMDTRSECLEHCNPHDVNVTTDNAPGGEVGENLSPMQF